MTGVMRSAGGGHPGQRRGWWIRCAAAVVAGGLLAGCGASGGGDALEPTTVTYTPTVAGYPSPSPSPTEAIEFVYEPPASPCLPASELTFLPSAGERDYELVRSRFSEQMVSGGLREYCTYQLAEIGDGDDMVLAEHVFIRMDYTVYREWEDSPLSEANPELPVGSDDLELWRLHPISGQPRVVWEGCGPAVACADGAEPTVRTYGLRTSYAGRVGNLEFDVRIMYIAERLPADVKDQIVSIFRDLVLAVVDSKERVR